MRCDSGADIEMHQSKCLNNLVDQDHRGVKRLTRAMLGFKKVRCARALIAGIETMRMIKKGELDGFSDAYSCGGSGPGADVSAPSSCSRLVLPTSMVPPTSALTFP